ncbi:hypothetical protein DSECCO2_99610 [anaerobic digester metagenome]
MIKNSLLKFSVEALLHEANPNGEPYFKKTYFYKTLYLLHNNLKKKSIDIELPYCWYLHGPLIEKESFEDKIGTKIENYFPNNIGARIFNIYDDGIAEKEKQLILTEIRKILNKYRRGLIWNEDYGDAVVGESYKSAPYKYQVTFKRDYLPYFNNFKSDPKLYELAFEKISQNLIKYLDKLINEFPENDMSDILDDYLFWDEIIRLKIENVDPFNHLLEFSDEYWDFFCKLLRTIKNENILPPVIERWENEFVRKQPIFIETLDNNQKESFKKLNLRKELTIDPDIDRIVRGLMGYARDSATQIPKEM